MGKQGGDTEIDNDLLAVRVDTLVRRGLDKYAEGDLTGALSEWEHALLLDAGALRARDYIEYVRHNFDLLEEQFEQAREAAAAAVEAGVPVPGFGGGAAFDDDDDDAYEAFEVGGGGEQELTDWVSEAAAGAIPDGAIIDEGWELDDIPSAAPLPPTPDAARDALGPGFDLMAEEMTGVDGGEVGDGRAEAAGRDALSEPLSGRSPAAPAPQPSAGDEADFGDLNAALDDTGDGLGPGEIEEGVELEIQAGSAWSQERPAIDATPDAPDDDGGEREAGGADADGDLDEETVPGGDEPPPLPERPSLADEAIAAIELERPDTEEPPGNQVPSDFDLGEVGRLDHGVRDDRIDDADSVRDVRVTFHEVGTSEKTMPARPSQQDMTPPATLDLELEEPGGLLGTTRDIDTEDGDEQTVERASAASAWPAAFDDMAEDEQTRDRSSHRDLRPPTEDPMLRGIAAVIVEDGLIEAAADQESGRARAQSETSDEDQTREVKAIRGVGDDDQTREVPAIQTPDFEPSARGKQVITGVHSEDSPEIAVVRQEATARQISAEVDDGAPDNETDAERTRRRVGAFVDRAEAAFKRGRHGVAVTALDLALDEKPDSAAAQKIVHRHRELMFKIYESYIGDDKAIPMVALPMHEIALQQLDSRSAFLLSRIDGTLTFEEILDVAGMSRLEAYRHLCKLLLRGILEVR
jgi:hypothetical protein